MNKFWAKRIATIMSLAMVLTSVNTNVFASNVDVSSDEEVEAVVEETTIDEVEQKDTELVNDFKEIVKHDEPSTGEAAALTEGETVNVRGESEDKVLYSFTPLESNYYEFKFFKSDKIDCNFYVYKTDKEDALISASFYKYDYEEDEEYRKDGAFLKAGEKYYVYLEFFSENDFSFVIDGVQELLNDEKTEVKEETFYKVILHGKNKFYNVNTTVYDTAENGAYLNIYEYIDGDIVFKETKWPAEGGTVSYTVFTGNNEETFLFYEFEDCGFAKNSRVEIPIEEMVLTDGKASTSVSLNSDNPKRFIKYTVGKNEIYELSLKGTAIRKFTIKGYKEESLGDEYSQDYTDSWGRGDSESNVYAKRYFWGNGEQDSAETQSFYCLLDSDGEASLEIELNKVEPTKTMEENVEVRDSVLGYESCYYSFTAPEDGTYIITNLECNAINGCVINTKDNSFESNFIGNGEGCSIDLSAGEKIIVCASVWDPFDCPDGSDIAIKVVKKQWEAKLSDDGKTLKITGKGDIENGMCLFSDSFRYYSVTKVIIGDEITGIGNGNFANMNNLKTVQLGKKVEKIGDDAFRWCDKLETINLDAASLKTIGAFAFLDDSNVKNIKIGKKVTSIGSGAFLCMSKLKSITVHKDNTKYMAKKNVLYSKSGKKLILYPTALTASSFVVPDKVEKIDTDAFYGNTKIKTITLGKKVSSLGDRDYALRALRKLKTIKVAKGNKSYKAVNGTLYSANGKTFICYPVGKSGNFEVKKGVTKIAYSAFAESGLNDVVMPTTLKQIDDYAFERTDLKAIKCPNGMDTINEGVFVACYELDAVGLPKSMKKIGSYAFATWGSEITTYYAGNEEEWSTINIEEGNSRIVDGVIKYNSKIPSKQKQVIKGERKQTVGVGEEYKYLGMSAAGKITYKCSNTKIAKISSDGKVTAIKPGKCTITVNAAATSLYKKAASVKVTLTVVKGDNPVYLSKNQKNIYAYDLESGSKKFSISSYVKKAQGKVTYSSLDKDYVTVSSKGDVTVKKNTPVGSYCIKVKAAGSSKYKAGSCYFYVYVN